METGRGEHTLSLIDAALQRVKGRTDAASEALYVVTRARALAMAGRSREAVAEAARAARLVGGADERGMPFWAALWGSAGACVGNGAVLGGALTPLVATRLAGTADGLPWGVAGYLLALCAVSTCCFFVLPETRTARADSPNRMKLPQT